MKSWKLFRQSPIITVAACGLLATVLTALLAMLAAKLMDKGLLQMQWRIICAYGIVAICTLVSCIVTGKQIKKYRLLFCLATAGLYYLLLLVGNSLLCKAAFMRMLPTAGIICAAALVAALLGSKRVKKIY